MRETKNLLGTISGYIILSGSLALLFIYAEKGLFIESMAALTGAWTGYLITHWSENGKLIDTVTEKEQSKVGELKIALIEGSNMEALFIGLIFFIAGVGILALGLGKGITSIIFTGTFSAMAGYFTIHEGITGKIV